jgi:MFS family permease
MRPFVVLRTRLILASAMFLALVPVTLPVPGLNELVVERHGATESQAHAFMSVNMIAGMIGVVIVMRLLVRRFDLRALLVALLVLDAAAFLGMGRATSLVELLSYRAIDGVVHLPAVTVLMVAANRSSGEHRGAALGTLAMALMLGVAVGSPLGGWLVDRDPALVYSIGSGLLALGAVVAATPGRLPPAPATPRRSRYGFDRRTLETWVPLAYAFMDRFAIGIFVSTFTLFLTSVHGLSASQRGVLIALFMLPFAALCYPAGRLADRRGWFVPLLVGNAVFGLLFALYGVTPRSLLPLAMILSGVSSALMFAPNLVLTSELAKRQGSEGLFGAAQIAGSLGFLTGPIVGGVLVAVTTRASGVPAYAAIFAGVGILEILLAVVSFSLLRHLAREARPSARGSDQMAASQAS